MYFNMKCAFSTFSLTEVNIKSLTKLKFPAQHTILKCQAIVFVCELLVNQYAA